MQASGTLGVARADARVLENDLAPSESSLGRFQTGAWEVDPLRTKLSSGGSDRFLEPKVMDLFCRLAEADGQVVSKRELLDSVWAGTYVTESVLTRAVSLLRRALGDDSRSPTYIETIPRRGYRLRSEVTPLERDRTDRRISIAVLPFEEHSAAPADYFMEGLTDLLIDELARIRAFRVISRTSCLAARRTSESLPAVARQLGVDWVVEGTVWREEEEITVSVRLIAGATGEPRWVERYRHRTSALLKLQEELGRTIAGAIERGLVSSEAQRVRAVPFELMDLYLRGRQFFHLRSKEGLQRAVDVYRQVLRIDETHVPSLCGIAESWVVMSLYGFVGPVEARKHLSEAVDRALSLDPESPDARRVEAGLKHFFDWDFPGARTAAAAAVRDNPSDPISRLALANAHASLGEYTESVAQVREGSLIDPLDPAMTMNLGDHLLAAGATIDAAKEYETAIDLAPNFPRPYQRLAQLRRSQGEIAEAHSVIKRAIDKVSATAPFVVDAALNDACSGDLSSLRALVDGLEGREPMPLPFVVRMLLHTATNDLDRVFAEMEQAPRGPWLFQMLVDPDYLVLRQDPRLASFLERAQVVAHIAR